MIVYDKQGYTKELVEKNEIDKINKDLESKARSLTISQSLKNDETMSFDLPDFPCLILLQGANNTIRGMYCAYRNYDGTTILVIVHENSGWHDISIEYNTITVRNKSGYKLALLVKLLYF